MGDGEPKPVENLAVLSGHYKDTYDIHQGTLRQRDWMFLILVCTTAVFILHIHAVSLVNGALSGYLAKEAGVTLDRSSDLFSPLLWLLLMGVSLRYFQVNTTIERQYGYLQNLEILLNSQFPGSCAYTREGRSYLDDYPVIKDWTNFLYRFVFPVLLLVAIIWHNNQDILRSEARFPCLSVGFLCYELLGTTLLLYMVSINGEHLTKLRQWAGKRKGRKAPSDPNPDTEMDGPDSIAIAEEAKDAGA